MELLWTATIWTLWSCWLICQYLRAPAPLTGSAAALLVAELVALAIHWFGCADAGCGAAAQAARSVASLDIPVLAGVLVAASLWHGWRRAAAAARGAGG